MVTLMRIQAIIFDLDGTLYSNKTVRRSLLLSPMIFSRYLFKLESARKNLSKIGDPPFKIEPLPSPESFHQIDLLN